MPSSVYTQKNPLTLPDTINLGNGVVVTSKPPTSSADIIASPTLSSGGMATPGQNSQGAPDYTSLTQQRMNTIKADPTFNVKQFTPTIPTASYTYTSTPPANIDFGGNKSYENTQKLINDNNIFAKQAISDQANADNSVLDSTLESGVIDYTNQANDLENLTMQGKKTLDTNLGDTLRANNQDFQDAETLLQRTLRANGALDSSANDSALYGSSRYRNADNYVKNQTEARSKFDDATIALDTSYNSNKSKIIAETTALKTKIANQKELNTRQKDLAMKQADLDQADKLNTLETGYQQYQSEIAKQKASASANAGSSDPAPWKTGETTGVIVDPNGKINGETINASAITITNGMSSRQLVDQGNNTYIDPNTGATYNGLPQGWTKMGSNPTPMSSPVKTASPAPVMSGQIRSTPNVPIGVTPSIRSPYNN